MPELESILAVAQAGAIPMLTVAVVVLWRRLNTVTDQFNAYLRESALRGDVAAQVAIDERSRNR